MVWEKTVSVNFGRAWWGNKLQTADTWYWGCHALPHRVSKALGVGLCPRLQTPSVGAVCPGC